MEITDDVMLPQKCQLTLVFKNGTTVQIMIAMSGHECERKITDALANDGASLNLPCIVKDEKVLWDRMTLIPENIMFFSVLQPKAESRVLRPSKEIVIPQ